MRDLSGTRALRRRPHRVRPQVRGSRCYHPRSDSAVSTEVAARGLVTAEELDAIRKSTSHQVRDAKDPIAAAPRVDVAELDHDFVVDMEGIQGMTATAVLRNHK